jgi:hypothetical protein
MTEKMTIYDIKLNDPTTGTGSVVLTLMDRRQDQSRPSGEVTIENWVKSLLGEEWWLKNRHNISIIRRSYEDTENAQPLVRSIEFL